MPRPLGSQSLALTLFLAALAALSSLSIDMGLPSFPALEAALPGAAGRGALTLSLFMAGFAVSPLFTGPVSDRFGRRKSLLVGLAGFTTSALACALTPSFRLLLTARLVQGAAAGLCVIQPLAIVRDLLKGPDARKQIAQMAVVLGLAPLAAPLVGSVVLAWGTWRTLYLIQALIGVAVGVWTALSFGESLPADRRQPLSLRQIGRSYRAVFGNRTFLGYALVYAVGFGGLFTYISGSPSVFIGEFGMSEGAYSGIFAVTAFGLILGSLVNARLATVSARRILQVGLGTGLACSLIALTLAGAGILTAGPLVALVFVIMVTWGMVSPTTNHQAIEPLPHVAGVASGSIRSLQMVMGAGTSALFTAVAGRLIDSPSLAMTVMMTALMLVTVALYVLLIHGRREHAAATPVPIEAATDAAMRTGRRAA